MAVYCFCGCGRKVRLSKKRLSQYGAEIRGVTDTLERLSLPITKDHPTERQKVELLIDHGRKYEEWFKGMIHGTAMAPDMSQQAQFHDWLRAAGGIAKAHTQRFEDWQQSSE